MIVVDASIAVALAVHSQRTPAVAAFVASRPGPLRSPAIFPYEVRNALLKLERRFGLAPADIDRQFEEINDLLDACEGPLDAAAHRRVAALARSEVLSYFDACYLDLALGEGAALASRDGPLLESALRRGVAIHDLR